MRGLLCAMLSMKTEEITDIVITNPIKEGEEIDDKKMILDVKVEVNHTQTINLEMQVENLGNWPERSLTYLCRMCYGCLCIVPIVQYHPCGIVVCAKFFILGTIFCFHKFLKSCSCFINFIHLL